MKTGDDIIRLSRILYKCMNCEHAFEDLYLYGEYGIRVMFCTQCHYQELANLMEDEYSKRITIQLRGQEQYKRDDNLYVIEFERMFDETVDPCLKCGGELSLSAERRCPKCNSTKLEKVRIIGYIDTNERWITHNKMENK